MSRPRITLRIPAELHVFVPAGRRGETTEVVTDGASSLGHVVESVGVPLTVTVVGSEAPAIL